MKNLPSTLLPAPLAILATGLFLVLVPARAATNPPAKTPKTTVASTNAVTDDTIILIAESEFVIPANVAEGRDPFFPVSNRGVVSTNTNKTANIIAASLILKGISGTNTKRFALINNRTFAAGEDADVTAGKNKVHVRCIRIEETSAVIEVDGKVQELKLNPGF